jgi:predicted TIM-barrel fold metal-dependent hydrolase
MRVWDCHVHCRGDETGDEVLRAMDAAGIERMNLFSDYPWREVGGRRVPHGPDSHASREDLRACVDHIAKVQSADPSRIYALVWVDPRSPFTAEEVERGIADKGLRGIKLIPDQWFPYDEMLFPLYGKMEELGRPIMFHSGIVYGFGDSSRYCVPVGFEALLNFPRLRFSLAHLGWPWVDEYLAVFGSFWASVGFDKDKTNMFVDTCPGTPDAWRTEALQKAVPFVGSERLMFGTDAQPRTLERNAPRHIGRDLSILREVIGVSEEQLDAFFWGACERFMAE